MYNNYPNNYIPYNSFNRGPVGYEPRIDNVTFDNDERFFWAPFVVGGLAGTALGYGIANNNQLNNGSWQPVYPMYPYPVYQSYPVYPSYSTSNNYYY